MVPIDRIAAEKQCRLLGTIEYGGSVPSSGIEGFVVPLARHRRSLYL